MNENHLNVILDSIEDIIYYGDKDNFFIIHLGEYYIQMAASRGDYEVYCEAVCNYYLHKEDHLEETQIQKLLRLGWSPPERQEQNYFLNHKVDSESERTALAELILMTSGLVYDWPIIKPENINLNLQ